MDTKIPWTEKTWNPIRGCTPVSAGCDNCYAERIAKRFKDRSGPFNQYFAPTMIPERLDQPLHWKKPRMVFVCSMGDLFHENITDEFIRKVFSRMVALGNNKHIFQILTKRPERMKDWFEWLYSSKYEIWPNPIPNVWLGVTVENQEQADKRIPILLQTPAALRFVSCEPLLGPIDLWGARFPSPTGGLQGAITNWSGGLDWIIVGGETGPGARVCDEDWVRDIWEQCFKAKTPFFFKAKGKNWHGNTSGVNWNEMREWPQTKQWR